MNVVPLRQLDRVDQFLLSFTSPNTRSAYQRDLRDYVSFSAGSDPFSFSTLASYRAHLIASSAPATVVRKFSAVKSFMSFLASEGVISTNPAQNLKLPRSRTTEHTQAFDDAEVVRVIQAADLSTFQGSVERLALVVLFHCGLRRSELLSLRVSSVAEHRGRRHLVVDGKGGKQRVIAMSPLVASEVDAYLSRHRDFTGRDLSGPDFLVRPSPDAPGDKQASASMVYRLVTRCARAAGVTKRVSPHSCRATMISHLLEKEVSPRAVADLAGHSSIQTTVGIYDRKRDALTNPAAQRVSYEKE